MSFFNTIIQNIARRDFIFCSCLIIIISMVTSRVGISIGMIGLIAAGIIRKDLGSRIFSFFRQPVYVLITGVFFIYGISGLYSENTTFLLERLRIKLPFLLLPFAFSTFPALPKKYWQGLMAAFVTVIFLAGIYTLINYSMDFKQINLSYMKAKVIPTPIDHVRFSLMVVFSSIAGLHLFSNRFHIKYPWERHIILGMVVFLILFLHILAVRSGLLTLYIAFLYLLAHYTLKTRKWGIGLGFLAGLVVLPVASWFIFPTLQNKLTYAHHDYIMFSKAKKINNLSDGGRMVSILNGLEVGRSNLWLGVGMGDVRDQVNQIYQTKYPKIEPRNWLIPHNQFVFVFAGTGLIGASLFIGIFFSPLLLSRAHRKDYLLISFHLIIFTSFLMESTIEVQYGTTFYILFLLLLLNRHKAVNPQDG